MKSPLIRHSPPSPASTGWTLLRTIPPPMSTECDAMFAARPCWMRRVETLKACLLALDHVVRDDAVICGDQFGGRVGEGPPALPSETYSSTMVTWLFSPATIRLRGWVRSARRPRRDKQQVDRGFEHGALGTCTYAPSSRKAVFRAEKASRWYRGSGPDEVQARQGGAQFEPRDLRW